MPVDRTPPPMQSGSKSTLLAAQADYTKVPTLSDSELTSNVSKCSKRKREDIGDSEMLAFESEILCMFGEFEKKQQEYHLSLQSLMEQIKEQNTKLQESIEFTAAKYDDILERLVRLENNKKEDRSQTRIFKERIELLEKQIRSASIEIRNIPKNQSESKQDLANIVITIGNIIKIPIQNSDIKDVFRPHSKLTNKPIVVEVATVLVKEKFIKSSKYNKEHKDDKLNTGQLSIKGPRTPVFIFENLTPKSKHLFYLARKYAVMYNYKFCWTSFGKEFLRKMSDAPQIGINSESDTNNLKDKEM